MSTWPGVELDLPVRVLAGMPGVAVEGVGPDGRGTIVYVEARSIRGGRVCVSVSDTATRTPMPRLLRIKVDGGITLRELLLAHAGVDARSAAQVPGLRWPSGTGPGRRASVWISALLVSVMILAALALRDPVPLILSGVIGAVIAGLRLKGASTVSDAQIPATALDGEGGHLLPSRVRSHLPARPVINAPGPTPLERVNAVRDAYAHLRDDIAYRIENSALFDPGFPPTQRLEVALLAWSPESDDAHRLASEVEDSFVAGRAAAEALGFSHLPETARGTARRALAVARLALAAPSDAERAAAAKKAAELLGSLALYYLPTVDPDVPSLIAQRHALLPPA